MKNNDFNLLIGIHPNTLHTRQKVLGRNWSNHKKNAFSPSKSPGKIHQITRRGTYKSGQWANFIFLIGNGCLCFQCVLMNLFSHWFHLKVIKLVEMSLREGISWQDLSNWPAGQYSLCIFSMCGQSG